MHLYLEFIKNTFQAQLFYKADTLFKFCCRIMILLIQVAIWRALWKGVSGGIMLGKTVVSFSDMVTYSILSTSLTLFMTRELIWMFEQQIRTGEIAMNLIKPINFKLLLFSRLIGMYASRFIIELLPLLVIGILGFGIKLPLFTDGVWFLIALVNGVLVNFYLCFIVGLLGFWVTKLRQFDLLLQVLMNFFAGSFLPLWFFPKGFAEIALALPFRAIYYTPISIYLGKAVGLELVQQISLQIFWLVGLYAIERLMWKRAVRKLVILGAFL